MTYLLCKLFIKDRDDVKSPSVIRAYGTLSSVVGIILNLMLAAIKLLAGVLSASISITADAINNLSDAGSQVISFISFKMSSKPADKDHPFGHARIEYVASMIVSFMIISVSFELFRSSVGKIINPVETSLGILSAAILVISILTKLWIFIFNRAIAKRIGSTIIKATALDSLSDVFATCAVLASMLISKFTSLATDGYMGVAVSVVIFVAGIKVLNETKNSILGSPPDPQIVDSIRKITEEYPEILGIHDMVVHNYGAAKIIASLHAEVNGEADVFTTHDVIDNIEKRLLAELGVQTTIHMDPIVMNDEETNHLRALVSDVVKQIDERLTIHDFRFVKGTTHSNLIFDVCAPFELKLSDSKIKMGVSERIGKLDPNYFAVITIDRQ